MKPRLTCWRACAAYFRNGRYGRTGRGRSRRYASEVGAYAATRTSKRLILSATTASSGGKIWRGRFVIRRQRPVDSSVAPRFARTRRVGERFALCMQMEEVVEALEMSENEKPTFLSLIADCRAGRRVCAECGRRRIFMKIYV